MSGTPGLWWMVPRPAVQQEVDRLQLARPPKAEVVNLGEIYAVLFGAPGEPPPPSAPGVILPVAARDLSGMAPLKLRVAEPGFAFDFATLGLPLASRRLREALALAAEDIQYLDVDCGDCAQAVRDADYRAINLLRFANPLDRARTGPGNFVDVDGPDGTTFAWVSEPPHPSATPPRIAWRTDFVAPAPLFRVPGMAWTLATEALAERVAQAGIDDVAFLDVTNDGTRTGMPQERPAR